MPTEYPVPGATNPPPSPRAWDPGGIAGMAVMLSFLPAGILWSLNWGRFGQPEKVRSRLFFVVALFVPYLAAAMAVGDRVGVRAAFGVVNMAVAWFFHSSQKNLHAQHLAAGGTSARFGKPVLYSIVGWLSFAAVVVGYFWIGSSQANAAVTEGLRKLDAQDNVGARAAFERARRALPDDPTPYWDLAIADERLHRFADARREIEMARSIDADYTGPGGTTFERFLAEIDELEQIALGNERLEIKDLDGARTHYEQAARINPRSESAHWNLEIAYRRMGRTQDALRELDILAELAPDFRDSAGLTLAQERLDVQFEIDFDRAAVAIEHGDGPTAIASFTRLVQARPDNVPAHWNLALAHTVAGDPETARRELAEVRRLDPEGRVIAHSRQQAALDALPR